MSKKIDTRKYKSFVQTIKKRINEAQYEALKKVNKELIELYWDIGQMIIEKQEAHNWGKSVVENLAKDLQAEYPGLKGFSSANLWRMRNFHETYKGNQKLAPLVREISWTKNVVIMEKCKSEAEQYFYMVMTKKFAWTKNVLLHKIGAQEFEKFALNQTNFEETLPKKIKHKASLAVKDEYTFNFLELAEDHSEYELEQGLIKNIRKFLLEMGGYFCFIANQYRIEVDDSEFFIDLLLYHRQLKCLVAIDLKIGKFQPEHAGKMNFYLSALNDTMKLEDENPSIGIIICRDKGKTMVEYALKDTNKPIGISTYTLEKTLPEALSKYLPSQDDLVNSIENFEENLN